MKVCFIGVKEAIKALRKERGYTQVSLARELQKTETTIRRWEIGIHEPPPDTLLRLAGLTNAPELKHFFAQAATPAGFNSTVEPQRTARGPSTDSQTAMELHEALQIILERAPETIVEQIADRLTRLAGTYAQSDREKKLFGKAGKKTIDKSAGREYTSANKGEP